MQGGGIGHITPCAEKIHLNKGNNGGNGFIFA